MFENKPDSINVTHFLIRGLRSPVVRGMAETGHLKLHASSLGSAFKDFLWEIFYFTSRLGKHPHYNCTLLNVSPTHQGRIPES